LNPAAFRFVIVQPRYDGNVGAAARALKNLGFRELFLVTPDCDPMGEQARRMAVDAIDVLEGARVHDTLDEALEGAGTVVGTSRRTGKHRKPHYRLDRLTTEIVTPAQEHPTAILFGREDHGLYDRELDRCTHLLHLPSDEAYPSINVAQSILLVAWELRRSTLDPADADPLPAAAEHSEREAMYAHLERALATIGHIHRDTVEPIMRRFRRLLGRASISSDEVRLLRGMAHQILWAAGRAGLEPPGGDHPPAVPVDEPQE
jgi:tRNA/rRNA methyltransferase